MFNQMLKTILCAILVAVSVNSAAALRQYTAKVENSDWRLKDETRLQCTLSHTLPGYGEAMFSSIASKQLNMEFELDMYVCLNHMESRLCIQCLPNGCLDKFNAP